MRWWQSAPGKSQGTPGTSSPRTRADPRSRPLPPQRIPSDDQIGVPFGCVAVRQRVVPAVASAQAPLDLALRARMVEPSWAGQRVPAIAGEGTCPPSSQGDSHPSALRWASAGRAGVPLPAPESTGRTVVRPSARMMSKVSPGPLPEPGHRADHWPHSRQDLIPHRDLSRLAPETGAHPRPSSPGPGSPNTRRRVP